MESFGLREGGRTGQNGVLLQSIDYFHN